MKRHEYFYLSADRYTPVYERIFMARLLAANVPLTPKGPAWCKWHKRWSFWKYVDHWLPQLWVIDCDVILTAPEWRR